MKESLLLGLDIGGANTKAALVIFDGNYLKEAFSYIEYFPFWEQSLNEISGMFGRIVSNLIIKNNFRKSDLDHIAITITAELSDAFQTKKDGIHIILDALEKIFKKQKMAFISINNEFLSFIDAKNNHKEISAANWVSTALFLGKYLSKCILIDAGSTTIDIIPILDSIPVSKGKDDLNRLLNHELIYTGGLRATIPSITHFIPYKNNMIRISFEKFALISDVYRILGYITEEEYINETADNRSKSIENCYARLARIICTDLSEISIEELDQIAKFIYEKHLELISEDLQHFIKNLIISHPEYSDNLKFVITGLSADFLIKKALESLGYNNIEIYEHVTKIPNNINSSAFAVAGAYYFQII